LPADGEFSPAVAPGSGRLRHPIVFDKRNVLELIIDIIDINGRPDGY
jgi:hypothetical protein